MEASAEKLKELSERRFDDVELLIIGARTRAHLDGIRFGAYHVIAAIGVDAEGNKDVLGLREGATENAIVVKALLEDLVERGVTPGHRTPLAPITSGSPAGREAFTARPMAQARATSRTQRRSSVKRGGGGDYRYVVSFQAGYGPSKRGPLKWMR
jgi:hypothetical protein